MNRLKIQKGKISLYLTLLVLVAALMVMLRACSVRDGSPRQGKSGGDTIDVAIEISPLSLSMAADTLGGFAYDMLRQISEKYHAKMKFHEFVPLEYALNGLDKGLFDMVVADLPSTTELKERYLLTDPIYLDRQVLVQRKDSLTGDTPIKEQRQLEFDTVWVVAGSPFVDRITNLAHEIGCDTIYVVQDNAYSAEQLFILTAIGEIKQAIVNEKIAESMLEDYPQTDINTKISFTQFQSWAIRKDNPQLLDSLNRWINDYKSTGDYRALYRRYFK